MAPGALPRPGRVPEQRLMSPEICLRRRRRCGTVLEISPIVLGFFIPRLFIGEGASSGGNQGGHTIGGCGQGLGRAPLLCGQPLAPLQLAFNLRSSSRKNRSSGTCFVQFQEYFLYSISETQKQQKIGNSHCGILLVGYFRKSHKNATKCNETQGKWCKNKHGASTIIDTFETYHLYLFWGSDSCL
jgi:hypothetical protein